MSVTEYTDPEGDGLTITTDGDQVWITCTSEDQEVTTGPLDPRVLTLAQS